jgi:hypothetical protein
MIPSGFIRVGHRSEMGSFGNSSHWPSVRCKRLRMGRLRWADGFADDRASSFTLFGLGLDITSFRNSVPLRNFTRNRLAASRRDWLMGTAFRVFGMWSSFRFEN